MTETNASLERNMRDSVGGKCDFPEKVDLPIEASSMRITKRVRGGMGEKERFKKALEEMVTKSQITAEEATKLIKLA